MEFTTHEKIWALIALIFLGIMPIIAMYLTAEVHHIAGPIYLFSLPAIFVGWAIGYGELYKRK